MNEVVYVFSHDTPNDSDLGTLAQWYVKRLEKDYSLRVDHFSYPAFTGRTQFEPSRRMSRGLLNRIVEQVGVLTDNDDVTLQVEPHTIFVIKRSLP